VDLLGKRFVVIGGAGFIGSHTVDALLAEDVGEVVIYDNLARGGQANLASALADPRVSVWEGSGDICDRITLGAALDGADGVFHFAALWLTQCQEFPARAFEVNSLGTFNVVEACVERQVQRLVLSSSASVYGDAVEEPMTEDHPLNAITIYGATKIAAEAMTRAMHHRYGLAYAGLRYMNVYGPRQDYVGADIAVVMKMLNAVDAGEPLVIYGDGSQSYDFVYVGDCANANVCAMRAQTADRFYNVGIGKGTSIAELAELVVGLTGSSAGLRYEPAGQTFVKNRIGDPDRAWDEIGFRATVELEDGLGSLIEWRNAHKAAASA
jgi:UDP-glucose 4-epimerase